MENSIYQEINKMYPYGEFPSQYTKQHKTTNINNPKILNYVKDQPQPKEHEQQSINTSKLDFNTILPLITNISSGNKDKSSILSSILPLIAGNKSKEINSILKLITNTKTKPSQAQNDNYISTLIPPSKYNTIDSYEKI